ncbi:MAG TPA: IS110 family transposase [Dehalococcoidia bacterium]|nr:IS110 family transposase [Dehalococcoidia bacterium]
MEAMAAKKKGTVESAEKRVAVGIDPSKSALQVSLLTPLTHKPCRQRLSLEPQAVNKLEELLQRHEAVIAIEGSHSVGQLFLLQLQERGHDVREVHPLLSKRFREAISEDHSDQKDADGLALLASWKDDLPMVSFSQEQAIYKRLSRLRTQLVRERSRYLNQLHACLVETYGISYKPLFGDLSAKKALRFFHEYPTINDALADATDIQQRVGPSAWEQLQGAGIWSESIYLSCLRTEVRVLASQILSLKDRVAEVEREMAKLAEAPEVAELLKLPRVGLPTALAIAGNTGDIRRFEGDVNRYVAYAGLAPALYQSGAGGTSGRRRRRYNRYLQHAFMFLAFNMVYAQPLAREYYDRKRLEGKRHWAAIRALARHPCRIVFRALTKLKPPQEVVTSLT